MGFPRRLRGSEQSLKRWDKGAAADEPVAVGKDGGGAVPLPLKDILGTNADGPGVTGKSTTATACWACRRPASASPAGAAADRRPRLQRRRPLHHRSRQRLRARADRLRELQDGPCRRHSRRAGDQHGRFRGGGPAACRRAAINSGRGYAAVLSGKVLVTDALEGAAAAFSRTLSAAGDAKFSANLTAAGVVEATKGVESSGDFKTTAGNFITTSGHFTTQTGTVTASDVILAGGDCANSSMRLGRKRSSRARCWSSTSAGLWSRAASLTIGGSLGSCQEPGASGRESSLTSVRALTAARPSLSLARSIARPTPSLVR